MRLEEARISIIGSGNLAWHLATSFKEIGLQLTEIVSTNQETGNALAEKTGARYTKSPDSDSDIFFLAVPDRFIEEVSLLPALNHKILIHCSGSVGLSSLRGSPKRGVLYPLHSFTSHVPVHWNEIPVCVESDHPQVHKILLTFTQKLGGQLQEFNSAERLKLHLSAVFAANFSVHMLTLAEAVSDDARMTPLLRGLFEKAVKKAVEIGPLSAQTGPALRGDEQVIEKHAEALEHEPLIKKIYTLLSASIQRLHGKKS